MAVTAMKVKSNVESLREIVQDLLVPELKALKVEMAVGFDSIRTEMRLRDEKQTQAIEALSDKLNYAIDIRERLASVEARLPRN